MSETKSGYIQELVERQKALVKSVSKLEEEASSIREEATLSQHMLEYLEREERMPTPG